MIMMCIVVAVVSGALVAGAAWGLYGKLPKQLEGFLIAVAGGALILSVVTELIEPSVQTSSMLVAMIWTVVGAGVFTGIDYLIDEKWSNNSGGGLLAAITLDGVPENLALGVALIGAGPGQIAALAGSILLSNLPEAAGGAKQMAENGTSKRKAMVLWLSAAVLLSAAAILGNLLLEEASPSLLAGIRCLAAGAVIASLATEVFPAAYKEDSHMAGIATALGFVFALVLSGFA